MNKMPELVKLRKRHGDEDLVVIGINFDADLDKTRGAIAAHGMTWPQVHAPTSAKGADDLWKDATGVTTLPRVFLIDRKGVMRADVSPHDLESHVGPLLREGR